MAFESCFSAATKSFAANAVLPAAFSSAGVPTASFTSVSLPATDRLWATPPPPERTSVVVRPLIPSSIPCTHAIDLLPPGAGIAPLAKPASSHPHTHAR